MRGFDQCECGTDRRYVDAGESRIAWFAVIGAAPRDITIDHNTIDNDGSAVIEFYGSGSTVSIYGFVLTNNLMRRNSYGIFGANAGEGTKALSAYTPGAIVLRNTFAGAAASLYPAGNDFPSLAQWLADFASTGGANYQLVSASRSCNAATDGKNLGVDFVELSAASAGSSSALPRIAAAADLVVYRPSDNIWYTLTSTTNFTASTNTKFGLSSDIPVLGDYDGDGKADPAIFRPSSGDWLMKYSSTGSTVTVHGATRPTSSFRGITTATARRTSRSFDRRTAPGICGTRPPATVGVQWGNGLDVPVPGTTTATARRTSPCSARRTAPGTS